MSCSQATVHGVCSEFQSQLTNVVLHFQLGRRFVFHQLFHCETTLNQFSNLCWNYSRIQVGRWQIQILIDKFKNNDNKKVITIRQIFFDNLLKLTSTSAQAAPGTVVKHKLYSWIMLGYKELKSMSKIYLSQNPFLGSKTKPPTYAGFFLPLVSKKTKIQKQNESNFFRHFSK